MKASPTRPHSSRQSQFQSQSQHFADHNNPHTHDKECFSDTDFYENPGQGSSPKRVYLSPEKHQQLVDRLTYEYKDKNKRREKEMYEIYDF